MINNFIIAVTAMVAAMCLVSVRVMPIQTRVSIAAPMAGIALIYFFVGDVIGDPDFVTSLRLGLFLLFLSIIINILIIHSLRRGKR